MPLSREKESGPVGAETAFREAFDRLKAGTSIRLPNPSAVTQNNVAKEAGCDPSALRKSRYPSLIAEIQHWIEAHSSAQPLSNRQRKRADRSERRSLRTKAEDLKIQRDLAYSLLAEADARIVELTLDNARLSSRLEEERPADPSPLRRGGRR